MVNNLDIVEITPYLNACGLLTQDDLQVLINKSTTPKEKALHLLEALPRKNRFFEKFLDCLDQTKNGTGHNVIHDALLMHYAQEDRSRYQEDL